MKKYNVIKSDDGKYKLVKKDVDKKPVKSDDDIAKEALEARMQKEKC